PRYPGPQPGRLKEREFGHDWPCARLASVAHILSWLGRAGRQKTIDCSHQFPGHLGFRDVRAGSGGEGHLFHESRLMLAENYDFGTGDFFADQPRGIQAIEARHGDIEHNHISMKLLGCVHRILAIACFSAHFPVATRFEQGAKSAPKDLVVIYDEYADSHFQSSPRLCKPTPSKSRPFFSGNISTQN